MTQFFLAHKLKMSNNILQFIWLYYITKSNITTVNWIIISIYIWLFNSYLNWSCKTVRMSFQQFSLSQRYTYKAKKLQSCTSSLVNIQLLVPHLWITGLILIVSWTIVECTFVAWSKVPRKEICWKRVSILRVKAEYT